MNENPQDALYVSPPSRRSMGQEYRIYRDRIELVARTLFRTLKIPFDRIVEIDVRSKPVVADAWRRPMETWWAYNNDWASFHRHVYIRRKGWPPRIRFVPDDPDAFVARCQAVLAETRE